MLKFTFKSTKHGCFFHIFNTRKPTVAPRDKAWTKDKTQTKKKQAANPNIQEIKNQVQKEKMLQTDYPKSEVLQNAAHQRKWSNLKCSLSKSDLDNTDYLSRRVVHAHQAGKGFQMNGNANCMLSKYR